MGHFRKHVLSIFLTEKCNLACTYCYLDRRLAGRGRTIALDFARRGIDDFLSGNPRPAVRFFADGEPTLAFDELVQIREYAAWRAAGAVTFEIQTNGVFSPAVARWIAANIDIVYISMDGPPAMHDALRPARGGAATSGLIMRNIAILKENPRSRIGIRATITPLSNGRQKELIDFFSGLGVNIVFADLAFCRVGSRDKSFQVSYRDFVDRFVEARAHAERLGVFYGTMFAVNFDERVQYACRSCLPTPHLTVDGYVSCCDMCVSGQSPLQELIYGRYDERTGRIVYCPLLIHRIRGRRVDNLPACRSCAVKDHCAGGCLGEALNETADLYGVKDESCRATRYLWRKLGGRPIPLPHLHP